MWISGTVIKVFKGSKKKVVLESVEVVLRIVKEEGFGVDLIIKLFREVLKPFIFNSV